MHLRRRPLAAACVLATFVATFLLPFVTPAHRFDDDPDLNWGEPQLNPPHPVTQVEPVYPTKPDEHCAICHWTRAFHGSVHTAVVVIRPPLDITVADSIHTERPSAVGLHAGSPRGPPAFL